MFRSVAPLHTREGSCFCQMMAKEYFGPRVIGAIVILLLSIEFLETRNKLDVFLDSNRRDCPDLDLTLTIYATANVDVNTDMDIDADFGMCISIYQCWYTDILVLILVHVNVNLNTAMDILMLMRGCVYIGILELREAGTCCSVPQLMRIIWAGPLAQGILCTRRTMQRFTAL